MTISIDPGFYYSQSQLQSIYQHISVYIHLLRNHEKDGLKSFLSDFGSEHGSQYYSNFMPTREDGDPKYSQREYIFLIKKNGLTRTESGGAYL